MPNTGKAEQVLITVLNLSLLQDWPSSYTIRWSFNGVSWFLSAILFCYFTTPALLNITKKKSDKISVSPGFALIIRVGLEFIYTRSGGNILHSNSPIICCSEYYIGITGYLLYDKLKSADTSLNTVTFSIAEAIIFCSTIAVQFISRTGSFWFRPLCVAFELLLILIFAIGKGLFSKLLSLKPFILFSNYQFEFYMFHVLIITVVYKAAIPYYYAFITDFILTMLTAYLYKKLAASTKKGENL